MPIEYVITILTGLVLGFIAGFVMHRSDFCMASMVRDFFIFKNTVKLKVLAVAVVVSMWLFEIARAIGLIAQYPFALLGPASMANLVGGFFFGIGMVLAGGCVVGVLYKMGSGSVLGFVALVGILFGSVIYAEIHDYWVRFIKATMITKEILLTAWMQMSATSFVVVFGGMGAFFIYKWVKHGDFKVSYRPEGYITQVQASVYIAILGLISYIIVGMPFGITTTYAKVAGIIESAIAPEHFAELKYFKLTTLDYTFALTGKRLTGGPKPEFDAIVAIQLPVIVGIVLGSFVSAVLLREFRVYLRLAHRQYISAFVGGVILGLASRLAQGCNIWHIFGGLPIFALQSILFTVALIPGAWVGAKVLTRFVVK